MAGKKITTKATAKSHQEKRKELERQHEEWTQEYMLDYCWLDFINYQYIKQNSPKTIQFYNNYYKKLCKCYISDVLHTTPDLVSIEMLENDVFQSTFPLILKKTGIGEQTVNAYLRANRAFGKYCLEKGYIQAFKCPIKEKEPPIKILYTNEELVKLREKPNIPIGENFTDWRNYCAIGIMLNCGARCNSLLNIKIKDIDFDEGYININTTKTNKVVRVGLDEELKGDLLEWIEFLTNQGLESEDYLLCNDEGAQMARSSFAKSLALYNKKKGVEKTSIHLFRHTFATRWIMDGGDIITLQKILTHSELDMVKRYVNLYCSDIKKEVVRHSTLRQLRGDKQPPKDTQKRSLRGKGKG